ncbi:MAG: sigma-54-dependent Fis family transcriptional regulator [Candidatus Hydrogenedentes bacterium]|nr:sigma-54-dependent Fis family transcriptional regulator [Candidatus Hydrogenedentota bacterium]
MSDTLTIDEIIRAPLNEGLLGISEVIRETREVLNRLAQSDITVLIGGESGTGKDIAARLLHKKSPRYGRPFIKVNCPAIPETFLESELFGYEKGAFTGARNSKPGRLELANNGTIFLDEIAETSYIVQGKLLQVLDGEPLMRIGGVSPIPVNVRVIAATNISLEEAVQKELMREDLFFRLSEVIVRMPPLRDRREDIPLLAEHFNYNYSERLGRAYQPIGTALVSQMASLDWVGNVRELGACVKKYVATGDPRALLGEAEEEGPVSSRVDTIPPSPVAAPAAAPETPKKTLSLKQATQKAVEETERALIEEALRNTLWNRRKAAKLLDISYSSLLRRIDAYKIGK